MDTMSIYPNSSFPKTDFTKEGKPSLPPQNHSKIQALIAPVCLSSSDSVLTLLLGLDDRQKAKTQRNVMSN